MHCVGISDLIRVTKVRMIVLKIALVMYKYYIYKYYDHGGKGIKVPSAQFGALMLGLVFTH